MAPAYKVLESRATRT